MQEVTKGMDIKLFGKYFGLSGSYSFEINDFGVDGFDVLVNVKMLFFMSQLLAHKCAADIAMLDVGQQNDGVDGGINLMVDSGNGLLII